MEVNLRWALKDNEEAPLQKCRGRGHRAKCLSREKGVGEDSCSGKRMVWGGGGPCKESDTTERLNWTELNCGEGGTRHMNLRSRPVLSCSRSAGFGGLTEVANSRLIASEDFDMDPYHVVLPKPKSLPIRAGICPLFLLCLVKMPLKTHIQHTPQQPSTYPLHL